MPVGQRYNPHLDPRVENQQRLRAYDMATSSDELNQVRAERMDFQQRKEAFDEAYKTSDAERKASDFQTRNDRLTQVNQGMEKLHDAQISAMQASQDAKTEQATLKAQKTAQVAKSAATIFKSIGTLDSNAPDYKAKIYQLLADNPAAADHPEVMKAVAHEIDTFDRRQDLLSKKTTQSTNATSALQDALASSHPTYGTADGGGKNFSATTAGVDPQTHVQTTYIPPGSTKPVTQVFPREFFDSMVAASQARAAQGVGPQAATAQPAPPVAANSAPTQPTATPSAVAPGSVSPNYNEEDLANGAAPAASAAPTTSAAAPTPQQPTFSANYLDARVKASTDPRAALAAKALSDPNAAPQHRAAAMQILGLNPPATDQSTNGQ